MALKSSMNESDRIQTSARPVTVLARTRQRRLRRHRHNQRAEKHIDIRFVNRKQQVGKFRCGVKQRRCKKAFSGVVVKPDCKNSKLHVCKHRRAIHVSERPISSSGVRCHRIPSRPRTKLAPNAPERACIGSSAYPDPPNFSPKAPTTKAMNVSSAGPTRSSGSSTGMFVQRTNLYPLTLIADL